MKHKLSQSLAQYNLKSPKASLIRHNENATYKITDSNKTYVLRIHQPTDGFSLEMLHAGFSKLSLIQNEVQIIDDLSKNTDILLQRPVYNLQGSTVSVLTCGTPATLLEWVEGETLDQAAITDELLFAIGRTVATMHEYLATCNQKYARFSYDQSLLPHISEAIRLATASNVIAEPQAQTIHSAIAEIAHRLDRLDRTGAKKHIVHSDLYKSNIIQNNRMIAPIDFSLCGYSHFYLDIAALLSHCETENDKQNLLAGYQSICKSEINPYFIEPYSALESLLFLACQHERSSEWDWWDKVVEDACEKEFKPLAARTPFWQTM